MKEVVDFIRKVQTLCGAGQMDRDEVEDVVDVLRIAYHTRRQDRKKPSPRSMSWGPFGPVFTAHGGVASSTAAPNASFFQQAIELFEGEVPSAFAITKFFDHVEDTEKSLHTAQKRVDSLIKAKKVIEVPDEAREILNELAMLNEAVLEAKTLRRAVRQLSEKAQAYTAPVLIEDDRPDDE